MARPQSDDQQHDLQLSCALAMPPVLDTELQRTCVGGARSQTGLSPKICGPDGAVPGHTAKELQMRTMTCKELGGACDLEFHANTFEEIAQMSQRHGKEMFQRGDTAHLEAMSKMREVMQSADGMTKWMERKRKEFEAKPDTK